MKGGINEKDGRVGNFVIFEVEGCETDILLYIALAFSSRSKEFSDTEFKSYGSFVLSGCFMLWV